MRKRAIAVLFAIVGCEDDRLSVSAARIWVSPELVEFGDVPLDSESMPMLITVENRGNLPLEVAGIEGVEKPGALPFPGPQVEFVIEPRAFTVQAGASTQVAARFLPCCGEGERRVAARFASNGEDDGRPNVELSGFARRNPPMIISFTARPAMIRRGEASTLSWSVADARTVGIDQLRSDLPPEGTMDVTPEETQVYTLRVPSASGDLTVDATVTVLQPQPLQVSVMGAGSVVSLPPGIVCVPTCAAEFPFGDPVRLEARSTVASGFVGWSGDCQGTESTCEVVMAGPRSVEAMFAEVQRVLTVTLTGDGEGTVTSTPSGISCANDCEESYLGGTTVVLTASAMIGSAFTGWSGACGGTAATCTVTMDQARFVTANFVDATETLTVVLTGLGSGLVTSMPAGISCGSDCTERYPRNTSVMLTATTIGGSTFLGWNGCVGVGPSCTVVMSQSGQVTAEFAPSNAVCGDGVQEGGEECDDGNLLSRDGCSSLCEVEDCGNGSIDPGEECDDGNLTDGDGCSSACLIDAFASVDIVSAGYGGMRTVGNGTITIAGVGTGTVVTALLYYHGPTNVPDANANAAITFAGSPIQGTPIGFSSDNCWSFQNSIGYRANVTSLVRGDGAYALSDLIKPSVEINGASLIVLFDDGDPSNNVRARIFDGNDSNYTSPFEVQPGWQQTYPGITRIPTATVTLEVHVADGQIFQDGAVRINGAEVFPAGSVFDGTTVPNGSGPEGLWDIRTVRITPYIVGTNTITLTSDLLDDCLSLVVALIAIEE